MTTKRKIQFDSWVYAFNTKYNKSIQVIRKPTLDNAWFSGFTDAEGCFTVSVVRRLGKSTETRVTYSLAQENEFELMSAFSELLDGIKYNNRTLRILGFKKLNKIIDYFPLKTKKQKDYSIWLEIYALVLAKKHLTKDGLDQINTLRLTLNADFKKARGIA
jgi:hypothetical protein